MAYYSNRPDGRRDRDGQRQGADRAGDRRTGRDRNTHSERRHPFVNDRWGEEEPQREKRNGRVFGSEDHRRPEFSSDYRPEGRRPYNRDDRFERTDNRRSGYPSGERPEGRRSYNRDDRFERTDNRRSGYLSGDRPEGRRPYNRDDRFERTDNRRSCYPSGERPEGRRSYDREEYSDRYSGRPRDVRGNGNGRNGRSGRTYNNTERGTYGRDRSYGNPENHRPRRSQENNHNPGRHQENDQKKEAGYIRLNRYIANAGVCSRREADKMIESGVILVNGEVCTVLGTLVGPDDKIQFGGQTLSAEKKVYLLMNKPKGYITTADDPQERKTVMDLLNGACRERIYPVGRLDRNTTGVLLFTNDGDMAKRLTHPSHGARKIYHVTLDNPLSKSDLAAIAKGVYLEDGLVEVDEIAYVESGNRKEVGIQLHSGKNRIVRRIFEHFGYEVSKLDRVLFAELTKKDLSRGAWRFLTRQEINFLKMNAGTKETKCTEEKRGKGSAVFTAEQLAEAEALAEMEVIGKEEKVKPKKTTVEKSSVTESEEEAFGFIVPRRSEKEEEQEIEAMIAAIQMDEDWNTEEAEETEEKLVSSKRKTMVKKATSREEEANEPKRKTARKKTTAEDVAQESEEPKCKTTRKKAVAEETTEEAEKKPVTSKRKTAVKKATGQEEEPEVPKRKTVRKKAAAVEEAAEEPEAPKRKTARKKAVTGETAEEPETPEPKTAPKKSRE